MNNVATMFRLHFGVTITLPGFIGSRISMKRYNLIELAIDLLKRSTNDLLMITELTSTPENIDIDLESNSRLLASVPID